ncbi:MAG: SRPBCC family protein [Pseudonocardia sp.]
MEWTGARYADQPTVERSIWIDAPPAHVWQIASDIRQMPEMSAELQEAEWLDGATGPEFGVRFRGRNRHDAIGEWETTSYVVECIPGEVFTWAVGDPEFPAATWRFTVVPGDTGGTWLTQWVRMGPAPSGLSRAIAQWPDREQKIVFGRLREWEAAMAVTLGGIKERAESGRGEQDVPG